MKKSIKICIVILIIIIIIESIAIVSLTIINRKYKSNNSSNEVTIVASTNQMEQIEISANNAEKNTSNIENNTKEENKNIDATNNSISTNTIKNEDKTNIANKNIDSTTSNVTTQKNNKVIAIDPGHQTRGNSEKEPIGPGASETKAKVTGGATGVSTGKTEYQLNLEVALKLKTALENKGYTVVMTRTTNNVNISNSERAKIANNANAAAFIRIHANSVDNSSVKGVLTMCQTANNKYNGNLASQSYSLSKAVLDNIVKETGAVNKGVTRTDDMSGINWCTVPTTIVEMGFMSNPEEDTLMANDEYQNKIVSGIVKGIEQFLK